MIKKVFTTQDILDRSPIVSCTRKRAWPIDIELFLVTEETLREIYNLNSDEPGCPIFSSWLEQQLKEPTNDQ